MDEAAKVLARLERIEALERGHGSRPRLIDELRALVCEAEAWVRAEGDGRAEAAVLELRRGAEGMS